MRRKKQPKKKSVKNQPEKGHATKKKWLNLMKKGNLSLYFYTFEKLVESHENKEAKEKALDQLQE